MNLFMEGLHRDLNATETGISSGSMRHLARFLLHADLSCMVYPGYRGLPFFLIQSQSNAAVGFLRQ